MSLLRAVRLWFLYYIWWAIILTIFSGNTNVWFRYFQLDSLYTTAMTVAVFHTAFKMKYGGFRGLYRSKGGLKGYYSRVKEERIRKKTEMANMKLAREAAALRYRKELENNVLNLINDVTDLRVLSNKLNISSAEITMILKEGIKQGRIHGYFQKKDTKFISDNYIKNRIRDQLLPYGNKT